jgi:hypothetical protein
MSFKPNSLEDILSGAASGGWEWFDQLPDTVKKQMETRQAISRDEARAVARAWREFYESPGGKKALELLFDSTLRRTSYFVNLGQEPTAMAVFGAFREGQNALAQEIARQIAAGLEEEIKSRDT